jgi:acyl-CoA thioesterase FadM
VAEWLETYRGVANPWECDVVEHLTIAYYFDRFADAACTFIDLVATDDGPTEGLRADLSKPAERTVAAFRHELRAGDALHIVTAITDIAADAIVLGHQIVDSARGRTAAFVAETRTAPLLRDAATRARLAALIVPWPGPAICSPAAPWTQRGPLTARDRVKRSELGEDGMMAQPAHIHRFSAAGMQLLAAVGMTGAYMQERRRGFSTFELDLTRCGAARAGDVVDVRSLFAHLGTSSLRLAHRMTGPGGQEIARLVQSGVHLDTDARRSAPIPDALRGAIGGLLLQAP